MKLISLLTESWYLLDVSAVAGHGEMSAALLLDINSMKYWEMVPRWCSGKASRLVNRGHEFDPRLLKPFILDFKPRSISPYVLAVSRT